MKNLRITQTITQRETESIGIYLKEIGRYPLLTVEEEKALSENIQKGDRNSLEKLVKSNLRFVVSVAKQYQNKGLPLDDLITEGNLGLIKAAEKFDGTLGFKFISYAVNWIRQSIIKAINDQSRVVRVPINQSHNLINFNRKHDELEQVFQRTPTIGEVALCLNIVERELANVVNKSRLHYSIDRPTGGDSDLLFRDTLRSEDNSPDFEIISSDFNDQIHSLLLSLPAEITEVLYLYFGLNNRTPLSKIEISQKLEISIENTNKLILSGISNLKKLIRNKELELI